MCHISEDFSRKIRDIDQSVNDTKHTHNITPPNFNPFPLKHILTPPILETRTQLKGSPNPSLPEQFQ